MNVFDQVESYDPIKSVRDICQIIVSIRYDS